jgi:polyisoprenyl-teichoic acid--peptidoglycan teichoic acid transferase
MKYLKVFFLPLFTVIILSGLLAFSFVSIKFNYPPRLLLNTLILAKNQSRQIPDSINILFLGLDRRDDWLEKNQDTDTIILANINTNTFETKLIPLPRDLWYQNTSTRINKIYQLSLDQVNPTDYVKKSFEDIVGQKIDNIIVLDTQILTPIIQAIGSVEVNLDYELIDDQYPNPDHISDPQNNPNPYITVSFPRGKNMIDSENVTYFVRSRKGSDSTQEGGTDIGRSLRQQLLIEAILYKIKQEKIYFNIGTMCSLYNIWSQQITKDIDDQTILAILFKSKLNLSRLNILSISLPVGTTNKDIQGVIYHPASFKNGAWVYLPSVTDYSSIHLFVDQQLN